MSQLMLPYYPSHTKKYQFIINRVFRYNNKYYIKNYYKKNRIKLNDCSKEWGKNNRCKTRKTLAKWCKKNPNLLSKQRQRSNRKRRQSRVENKKQAYMIIQESKGFTYVFCNGWQKEKIHCKITDLDILTLEHSKKNGSIDRKKYTVHDNIYKDIISGERKVDDLEVLCFNCNFKRTRVEGFYS